MTKLLSQQVGSKAEALSLKVDKADKFTLNSNLNYFSVGLACNYAEKTFQIIIIDKKVKHLSASDMKNFSEEEAKVKDFCSIAQDILTDYFGNI